MKRRWESEQVFLALYHNSLFEIDFDTGKIFSYLSGKHREMRSKQGNGYCNLSARNHSILAHRFIWLASGQEIPNDYEINHKNGIKSDNRLSNLECVTRSRNTLHARHELGKVFGIFDRDNTGENNGRSIMTWEKVREMRQLFSTGKYTTQELADKFGIKKSQASNILLGYQWIE